MSGVRAIINVGQRCRNLSTVTSKKLPPVSPRIKELQEMMQRPDGVPVHLKRGMSDKILYQITMGISLGGTCYALYYLYAKSFNLIK